MKKYLITGASGFVAYHFLNYLDSIHEDCKVLCLDTYTPNDSSLYTFTHLKLDFSNVNLLDYSALELKILSFLPTHIVHLASFSSVAKSWEEPIDSFMNNTNIFLNLIEIIHQNSISCRILSVGSSEEYGNVAANCIPINETVQLQPISPYAVARVSQEMLSRCYVTSHGLDIILTRSFNHIGPMQRDIFVIPSFIKQILENINAGNTKCIKLFTGETSLIRDFLDVRDVVRAYHQLLEKGIPGEIYNVCSGIGRSIKEIIDILSNLLSVKVLSEVDSTKIRPNDNKIIIGDNSKIKKEIGWSPEIEFIDSLSDTIVFWKQTLDKV